MKSRIVIAITFLTVLLLLVACGSSASETAEEEHVDDGHTHSMDEDMAAAHGIPADAAAVANPISFTDESVETGEAVFTTNCATCHGEKGLGDGPAAAGLESKPADLTAGHVQELSDGALFYIVSHGKEDTPMPAWEKTLSEDDRWNVVNFLRTLVDGDEDGHDDDEHMHEGEQVEDEHMEGDEHEAADHEHEEGDDHSEAEHEHDDTDDHDDSEHEEDEHEEDDHEDEEHEDGDEHEEDEHSE